MFRMGIELESVMVENVGCFRGQHRLNLQNGTDAIVGRGATGKTTLTDAIFLCLSGQSRAKFFPNGLDFDETHNPGGIDAKISIILSDPTANLRFRFTRTVRTHETLQGPVHAIDSLKAATEDEGEWVETRSARAQNSVFPAECLQFCILDSDSRVGNETWPGTGLQELLSMLAKAAAKQAAARETALPEFFRGVETLRAELIERTNESLSSKDRRYVVEMGDGGLVGKMPGRPAGTGTSALPTGNIHALSQTIANVASGMMPVTPPLIGDSLFGYLDTEHRRKLLNTFQIADRHVVLFLSEPEIDGLDLRPTHRLDFVDQGRNCEIKEARS